jgi:PAS domain S-box-containing protein
VLLAANPLFDEGGEYVGALAMLADITARKRAEEELRESRATLERAQEVGRIGSFVFEAATGRVSWSKQTCRIFGLDQDDFEGPSSAFYSIVHRDDRDAVRATTERAFSGEAPYSLEHRIVHPDGAVRWVHVKAEVTRDRSGRPRQLIGVVQDITERRHLEEQLHQAQKMEAVGRLAGGIAHDFNNLLGVILGYGALAMKRVGDEAVRGRIEEMVKAGEKAAGLTRQLLAFSRKQVLEPKVLDLRALVSELEKMLRRVIGEDIQLVTVADERLWRVKADPGQMEQVLVNLVVNARDAMPTGGRLTIETGNVAIDDTLAAEHPGLRPGDYVRLAVTDTGTGMDEETRRRVFEPFFTTKEPGKGTGLGLCTAYGTITQSGGHITVRSEPGRGTTFDVYLPRVDAPVESALPGEDRHVPGGAETILVVEDSDSLRQLACEILAENGYEVLEARSGAAALERAGRHPGRIDLVLTDVVMPGMSGRELAEKLAETRPAPRVIFMSGYTDEAVVRHGVLAEGTAFIQKPFQLVTLLSKVRDVLDRPAAG